MTERIKKLGNDIDDVEIRNISSFKDNRGSFREVWRKNESDINFVQDNFSVSKLEFLEVFTIKLKTTSSFGYLNLWKNI